MRRRWACELETLGEGSAVISMPYDPRLVGDPATGVIHGGAVSALMDTASGAAVMSHPEAPVSAPRRWTCGSTTCARRRPARRITARAECYHVTRSVAFVRADGDG